MRRPDEEVEPKAPAEGEREPEYMPREEPDAVPAEPSDKPEDPSDL